MKGILGMACKFQLATFVLFVGETAQEKQKRFFDLFAIPGCFFMLMHCTVMKFGDSSITTGLSDWITTQVSTSC